MYLRFFFDNQDGKRFLETITCSALAKNSEGQTTTFKDRLNSIFALSENILIILKMINFMFTFHSFLYYTILFHTGQLPM